MVIRMNKDMKILRQSIFELENDILCINSRIERITNILLKIRNYIEEKRELPNCLL